MSFLMICVLTSAVNTVIVFDTPEVKTHIYVILSGFTSSYNGFVEKLNYVGT